MKRIVKAVLPILLTSIGGLALIGGELDDSPGLGGIGLILISTSIFINYKFIKE